MDHEELKQMYIQLLNKQIREAEHWKAEIEQTTDAQEFINLIKAQNVFLKERNEFLDARNKELNGN